MKQPPWLMTALEYDGLVELPGPKHSNVILGWLDKLGAWWRDDETPWCGVFVAICFHDNGYKIPKMYMRAKEWMKWGRRITKPVLGCVAVFDRPGGGHVGFVVGMTKDGDIWILGGNQKNAVNVSLLPTDRLLGYRIPDEWDYKNAIAMSFFSRQDQVYSHDEA